MLLRPSEGVDPFRLLAYLRSSSVIQAMQDRVRGQTAHLHPTDLLDIPVDHRVFESESLARIADLLHREAALNDELNSNMYQQIRVRKELGEQSSGLQLAAE